MHVLFVHSIEIVSTSIRKSILEASGRIHGIPDFTSYAFGLFSSVIPLAHLICQKKNILHRNATVENLVQKMSSSSMNIEWFVRSIRDGDSVSVTSMTMSKLVELVITESSKSSWSSLRDKLRHMEKIFVTHLLDIEKNRKAMESVWKFMLEIDLNDDVVFEAVLETLRRRVKIVCWREMFMASDFEIVRDTNSKLEIKVQREGMFGTSRVSDKFENKLRETITYDVALFASRHYCFRVDGTLQPADRIADTKTNGDDDKSPFLKRIVSKRTEKARSSICGLGGDDNDTKSTLVTRQKKKNFMTHPLISVLFQKYGGLCQHSYVEDVVYENQARSGITNTFGTAWGLYLDLDGEGPWVTLRSGSVEVEDVKMFMHPDAVPKGWKWIDEWQVSCDVPGECDELGWAYGHSFSSIRCIGGSSHVTDIADKRQRRWIRRRRRLTQLQDNTKSSLHEAHSNRVDHNNMISRLHQLGRNPFASRFRHVRTQNLRRQKIMSSRFHRRFGARIDEDSRDKETTEEKKISSKSVSLLKAIQNHNNTDKEDSLVDDKDPSPLLNSKNEMVFPSDNESRSEEESWLE